MNQLRRKFAIGFGLGFVVFLGLMLYGDIQEIGRLLQNFRWSLLPLILGLTLVNYLLRGARFHYYLRQIGLTNISFWTSLRVFIGGFALTITPGKVGELIRVLWLKNITGAGPAQTAPATIVDRLADGLAMTILALLGALVYPQYRGVVLSILGVLIVVVIISQIRPLALWLLQLGEQLPVVSKFVQSLRILYESTYELLRFKNLVVGTGIGLVSWSAEGLAFYLVLIGLDVPGSFELMLISIFVLALTSILGGASTLPGGLGAAEAAMTALLQTLAYLPEHVAVTATLLIRFFTLWFAVTLGILTVIIWRKTLFGGNDIERKLAEAELVYEQTG